MNLGRTLIAAVTAITLSVAAVQSAQAQGQGGGQGRQDQEQSMQQKADKQQKRMGKGMQQRKHLREPMSEDGIFGRDLMTAEERKAYRKELKEAKSDQEWAEIRARHMVEMQKRAKAQGKTLEVPLHGQYMMTREEQQRFTERMQNAETDAERRQIRAEHRNMMRERADALGVDEPEEAE